MANLRYQFLSVLMVCAAMMAGPAYAATDSAGAPTVCDPVQDARGAPVVTGNGVPVRFSGTHDCAPTAPPAAATAPAEVRSYMVFFDFNKADITPASADILRTVASAVRQGQVQRIDVTGHTDTVGSPTYNMRLSQRRAESVRAELVRLGIPGQEISVYGRGETQLLVQTGEGVREPSNRRVEIVFP